MTDSEMEKPAIDAVLKRTGCHSHPGITSDGRMGVAGALARPVRGELALSSEISGTNSYALIAGPDRPPDRREACFASAQPAAQLRWKFPLHSDIGSCWPPGLRPDTAGHKTAQPLAHSPGTVRRRPDRPRLFLLKWRKVISGVLRLDYLPARRAGLSTAAH